MSLVFTSTALVVLADVTQEALNFSLLVVVAGFDQVFPMEKLFLFSPTELQMILCGDQFPQWTRDDIINYTEPKLGYTRERSVSVLCLAHYNRCAFVLKKNFTVT